MLNNNMDPEISNSSNNKELEGESYQIKTSMNFKTIYDISNFKKVNNKGKI